MFTTPKFTLLEILSRTINRLLWLTAMHSKNKGNKQNGNKLASWFVRLTQRAPNKRSCAQYSGDRLIRLIPAPQLLSIYTSGVPETRADTGKRRQCLRYEVSCFSFPIPSNLASCGRAVRRKAPWGVHWPRLTVRKPIIGRKTGHPWFLLALNISRKSCRASNRVDET